MYTFLSRLWLMDLKQIFLFKNTQNAKNINKKQKQILKINAKQPSTKGTSYIFDV